MPGMIDLNKLAEVSNTVACEKGWWDGSLRSVAALTLLMQSENAEALEDYRSNKALTDVWYEVKYHREVPGGGADGATKRPMTEAELNDLRSDQHATIVDAKPCGIPIEIADTLIRIADFAAHRNLDLNAEYNKLPAGRTNQDFEEALAESNYWISLAWHGHKRRDEAGLAFQLVKAADCLILMCEHKGIDIEKAIDVKTAFNRTRPQRHGNKRI